VSVRWRERDGVRWLEAELPGAAAAFTTRRGGVSDGAYESLNLGLLTGDAREAVVENRARASRAVGVAADNVLSGHQVHGAELQARDAAPRPNGFSQAGAALDDADGQTTATPGLAPMVLVADCLPIAVAGSRGVGMLHCGWRGLVAGIVERGARAVEATHAAIGPGIGPCCYEVGDEVLAGFSSLGEGVAEGRMLNLGEVARRLLVRAGVDEVHSTDLCTSCSPDLFFSHRRDGQHTGRQAGLAWLEP
jgi:YfiH family protein